MEPTAPYPTSVIRPWPLGLPLLQEVRDDPLGIMQRLHAEQGDIAHLHVLSTHLYYLFRPDMVRQVLVDHQDDFVKEERTLEIFQTVHGANVITTDGAVWERQRRILTPAFSLRRIEACTELMAAAADEGIRLEMPAKPGESALLDVDRLTTRITMDVILRALFSYQGSRQEAERVSEAVRGLSKQVMREFFWPLRPLSWLPYPGRAAKIRNLAVLRRLIGKQIEDRRSNPGKTAEDAGTDILALLLSARDAQAVSGNAALSDPEVYDNCVGLFGAGHDTSATALAWWIGLMATHADVAARVRDEVDGLPQEQVPGRNVLTQLPLLVATLKEAMRLYPPSAATFTRRAVREVRVGDLAIGKGALVVIPIWSMHRDSRWYPDPEAFKPERFMPGAAEIPRGAYMPFGAGPHVCLGQQFAMVEMALIASRLVRHFDVALDVDASMPAPFVDLVLKPTRPIRVRFTRRG